MSARKGRLRAAGFVDRRPKFEDHDDRDEVVCRLCGNAFQMIGWSHLRHKHGWNGPDPMQEYRRRFGVRYVLSAAARAKLRARADEHLESVGQRWTKARVLAEVRNFSPKGKFEPRRFPRARYLRLVTASQRYFGSVNAALKVAGVVPRRASPTRWTKPLLLRELRHFRTTGRPGPLGCSPNTLYDAGKRLFGSRRAALIAAGIKITNHEPWTKPAVLAELRRLQRLGKIVGQSHSQANFRACAAKVFGSFAAALKAAGIVVPKLRPPMPWDKARVLREIRLFSPNGQFERRRFSMRRYNRLTGGAIRNFGSLAAAQRAAGVTPGCSSPTNWTKELVEQRLRQRLREGLPLTSKKVRLSDAGLFGGATRVFKLPWSHILHALGLGKPCSQFRWTRKALLVELRHWLLTGRPGPLGKPRKVVTQAARRYFGSLAAAGGARLRSRARAHTAA